MLNSYFNFIVSIVVFIFSVVNLLIYGIFRKDFRRVYKRIFVLLWGKKERVYNI